MSPYTLDVIEYLLAKPLYLTMWFDGVLDLVQARDKALDEVYGYLDQFSFARGLPEEMIKAMFIDMQLLHGISKNGGEMSNEMKKLWSVLQFMIYEDPAEHLPVPVYLFIRPTMNTWFILHLLLSMGHYETEYDLILYLT